MWALVLLSIGELCLVHLLVALLIGGWIALALSLLTIVGIVWLIASIASFKRLPVVVDAATVLLRTGRIKAVLIDRCDIAGLRHDISATEAKQRDVLRLSLLAHPNMIIDLTRPVDAGRGRTVRAIAHRLDDPAAFARALAGASSEHLPGHGS